MIAVGMGWQRTRGFTVVELLIVIVVIGVLAALVLNSFANAQARARNAQTVNAVQSYAKAIIAYAQDNGSYPPVTGISCLGTYTPVQGCHSAGDATATTNTLNALRPYLGSTVPEPAKTSLAGDTSKGALYNYNLAYSTGYYIYFVIENSTTCPSITGLKSENNSAQGNGMLCRSSFPVL